MQSLHNFDHLHLIFYVISYQLLLTPVFSPTQCYYLGGLEESATGILGEMSKPLSWSMPADKVCEKLKKKDVQICDLRYGSHLYNDGYCLSLVESVSWFA